MPEETIIGLYAIWDKKSEIYDNPFFAISDVYAKRRYLLMMDQEQSPLLKWKDDFELHLVGKFNNFTGKTEDAQELTIQGSAIQEEK